jgi:soluble lytic murein transglycosylase-like protein
VGLTQIMPGTARLLAVDPHDPAANLEGGAHYLRQMLDLFDGNVERALAAYNAGPRRVLRAQGLPHIAETQAYVSTIIDRLTPDMPTGLMP